jgi:hypothetical protein
MSFGIKEDQNMPRKKHTPEEIVARLRKTVSPYMLLKPRQSYYGIVLWFEVNLSAVL